MVYLNSDLKEIKKYFHSYALSLNDYFTPPHSLKSHIDATEIRCTYLMTESKNLH